MLRLDGIPLLEKRANRYAAVIFYKKALSKVRANQVNWVFSAAQKCLCQLPRGARERGHVGGFLQLGSAQRMKLRFAQGL